MSLTKLHVSLVWIMFPCCCHCHFILSSSPFISVVFMTYRHRLSQKISQNHLICYTIHLVYTLLALLWQTVLLNFWRWIRHSAIFANVFSSQRLYIQYYIANAHDACAWVKIIELNNLYTIIFHTVQFSRFVHNWVERLYVLYVAVFTIVWPPPSSSYLFPSFYTLFTFLFFFTVSLLTTASPFLIFEHSNVSIYIPFTNKYT